MRQVINTKSKRKQKEHFWDEVFSQPLNLSFFHYFHHLNILQKRVDPESEPETSFSGLKKKEEVIFNLNFLHLSLLRSMVQ